MRSTVAKVVQFAHSCKFVKSLQPFCTKTVQSLHMVMFATFEERHCKGCVTSVHLIASLQSAASLRGCKFTQSATSLHLVASLHMIAKTVQPVCTWLHGPGKCQSSLSTRDIHSFAPPSPLSSSKWGGLLEKYSCQGLGEASRVLCLPSQGRNICLQRHMHYLADRERDPPCTLCTPHTDHI